MITNLFLIIYVLGRIYPKYLITYLNNKYVLAV